MLGWKSRYFGIVLLMGAIAGVSLECPIVCTR
jgi:hypothetical protein